MTIEIELKNKSSFTTADARKYGLSSRMLSYYIKKGDIKRLSRGIYRFSDYMGKDENLMWEELAVAAQRISNGVICLISALNYYRLTDEKMKEYWIAVPNSQSRVHFPRTRIIRMRNMNLGIKREKIADINVKIFDIERTIVDSFRLLDLETAIKALKLYISGKCGKPDIKKLNMYSKKLRIHIDKYIVALLA